MGKETMGFFFVILSVSYFIKYGDLHYDFFCCNYHGFYYVHGCIKFYCVPVSNLLVFFNLL